jgi:arylsulfatase A
MLLLMPALLGADQVAKDRPNVILIMTDDQGYGEVGCHGNNMIKTPTLDRLADQSIEFTHFYCYPCCSPTRAGLLTGRYCYRAGVWATWQGGEILRLDEYTMAEMFGDAGYRTAIFGKWHLGEVYPWLPTKQGFEDGLYTRTSGVGYFDTILERNLKPVPTKGYLTDVVTDAAIEYIQRHRKEAFFVYIPHPSCHSPLQAPEPLIKPYLDKGVKNATRYAMITSIDQNIGRLLDKLDELGLAGNTMVIFLTDNGIACSSCYNAGLRGHKGSVYEGGIRVPFFARWPGHFPAGKKVSCSAAHIDLMPTLAELCKLDVPKDVKFDGVSIAQILRGRTEDLPERMLFFHCQNHRSPKAYPNGAVLTKRYKMVNGEELYDLTADPFEKTNIAPKHPEMVADLRTHYDQWWEDVNAEYGLIPPAIPVGFEEENPSILLAWHAYCYGKVRIRGGYAGRGNRFLAWLTQWTSQDDYVSWNIDVVRSGRYKISTYCRCPKADEGSVICLSAGSSKVEARVAGLGSGIHNGKWAAYPLGTIELKKGKTTLAIKALSKPGKTVVEIERLLLEYIADTF